MKLRIIIFFLFFISLQAMNEDKPFNLGQGGYFLRNIDKDNEVYVVATDQEQKTIIEEIVLEPNDEIYFSQKFLQEKDVKELNLEVISMYTQATNPHYKIPLYTISIGTPGAWEESLVYNVVHGLNCFVVGGEVDNFEGFYERTLLDSPRTNTPKDPLSITEKNTVQSKPIIRNSREQDPQDIITHLRTLNKKTNVSSH